MSDKRTLREMMTEIQVQQRTDGKCIKEMHTVIFTTNPPGLIVQVDRNTQWRKSWRRHITASIAFLLLVVAIIAIIVQNWKE